MKYSRTRDVKQPSRGTELSAGRDFYVPEDSKEFRSALEYKNPSSISISWSAGIGIRPHSHVLIPSGILVDLESTLSKWLDSPYNAIALIAHNKSSIGIRQLSVAACVVDQDYQGEIHLSITNTSGEMIWIDFGQKLVQFLVMPILVEDWEEIDSDKLFKCKSERCKNGFGSTGSA